MLRLVRIPPTLPLKSYWKLTKKDDMEFKDLIDRKNTKLVGERLRICTFLGGGPASSLRKQPTFHDATTGFPAKWRLTSDCRNSILMTCQIIALFRIISIFERNVPTITMKAFCDEVLLKIAFKHCYDNLQCSLRGVLIALAGRMPWLILL